MIREAELAPQLGAPGGVRGREARAVDGRIQHADLRFFNTVEFAQLVVHQLRVRDDHARLLVLAALELDLPAVRTLFRPPGGAQETEVGAAANGDLGRVDAVAADQHIDLGGAARAAQPPGKPAVAQLARQERHVDAMRLDHPAFRHRRVEAARKERQLDARGGETAHQIHRIALEAAAMFQRITGESDFHYSDGHARGVGSNVKGKAAGHGAAGRGRPAPAARHGTARIRAHRGCV